MLCLPGKRERRGMDALASTGPWEQALPTEKTHILGNSPKQEKKRVQVLDCPNSRNV